MDGNWSGKHGQELLCDGGSENREGERGEKGRARIMEREQRVVDETENSSVMRVDVDEWECRFKGNVQNRANRE